jgi:hypothetical protein
VHLWQCQVLCFYHKEPPVYFSWLCCGKVPLCEASGLILPDMRLCFTIHRNVTQVCLVCSRLAFPTLVLWGVSKGWSSTHAPYSCRACKIGTVFILVFHLESSIKKESVGKESAGKESAGKESAGKESAGKESAGKESAGKESVGKELKTVRK